MLANPSCAKGSHAHEPLSQRLYVSVCREPSTLKQWESTFYLALFGGGLCYNKVDCKQPDMQELNMDLLAFSSTNNRAADIAIIQLQQDISFTVSSVLTIFIENYLTFRSIPD